ncbi:MAG: aminoglycoside phosphotransferase family protein [Phycisphaerales bacterium]
MSEAHAMPGHDLGPQLLPSLEAACTGNLHDIHLFRTDWQRGGAATAHARWRENGAERDVVIKLPVGPVEYRFHTALAKTDAPVPRLVASGTELGGYDFAWVIMEKLPGNPLGAKVNKKVFMEICDAVGRFYAHAERAYPIGSVTPTEWETILEKARQATHDNPIPHAQQWSNAIKKTQKALPNLLLTWRARPINAWCHGDLHPANALRREEGSPWGEPGCVLIDFAEVKPGHWVEDAVYLERLHWGRPEVLKGVKTTSLIAKARKNNGLENGDGYAELGNIRRVMLASCVPAFLHREGSPSYLEGALGVLEKLLPIVT